MRILQRRALFPWQRNCKQFVSLLVTMRFKISYPKENEHNDVVCCVGWNTPEEIFSCGDDHALLKWSLVTNEANKICELPNDVYPVDFHSYSRHQGTGKKHGQDQLLVTSTDGRFHLIGRNGRLEKSVEAHKGAVLVGRLSHDGTSLLTAGEDGQVKIWSRSGMLRSTVVQSSIPVYSAAWSPDCLQVLHTSGKMLVIKPLAPNTKANRPCLYYYTWANDAYQRHHGGMMEQFEDMKTSEFEGSAAEKGLIIWKAHEGLILKVAWCQSNGLIASGGEDCRYKVWDMYGRQLFSSLLHDFPITSLAWAPSGDMFAVGSFNTLRLCDKAGWSYSLEKPDTGSIYSLAWSSDGTQLAGACANNTMLLAHLIERRLEWQQFEAIQSSRKSINVKDVSNEAREKLEFPERVIQFALGYRHLVVITTAQCYVYTTNNFNTPLIFELREGFVTMVLLADRHFLLVERSTMSLYSYEGRLLASPRWPTLQADLLNKNHISLSPDTIALRDQADEKSIHLYEIGGEGNTAPLIHSVGVVEVALNQAGTATDRQLAIIDRNRDLFLATVPVRGSLQRKIDKLGVMVQSLCWNGRINMLSGMQDTALTVWYYPAVLFVDQRLTRRTTVMKDTSEFGKSPTVVSFEGNHIGVRRSDGALVNSVISPHVSVLHGYAESSLWQDALRLCRALKDETVWACLAAMAAHARELDTAEEAYAAINQVDKVFYIQHIKNIPIKAAQMAEMCLLGGNVQDAESILLQNGLIFRAIMANLHTHNWVRALELAIKYKTHVDTVLLYRKRYLDAFEKAETNDKFLQFKNEMELDEEKIEQKVALEYQKEKVNAH